MSKRTQLLYRYDSNNKSIVEWLDAQKNKTVSLTALIEYAYQKFGPADFNKALINFAVNNDHENRAATNSIPNQQPTMTQPVEPELPSQQPATEVASNQTTTIVPQSQTILNSQQAQGIRNFLSDED